MMITSDSYSHKSDKENDDTLKFEFNSKLDLKLIGLKCSTPISQAKYLDSLLSPIKLWNLNNGISKNYLIKLKSLRKDNSNLIVLEACLMTDSTQSWIDDSGATNYISYSL